MTTQVDEYTRLFGEMTNVMSQISTNYTGVAAISPLELPTNVSNQLKTNTKHCARAALPPLERLYGDAKRSVEDRLARNLYPEFVKYQLAQCMRSSLSVSRSMTGGFKSAYPGLGNAFCLTDPFETDNPIVYASDGLIDMLGRKRHEVMGKNCRLFQGFPIDEEANCRIRRAIALGKEAIELIRNYRGDGTPFWNLVFICPLIEQGIVRYFLGGQINVSESMGSDLKDISRILSFGLPGEDLTVRKEPDSPELPKWQLSSESEEEVAPSVRGSSRLSKLNFFKRFSKRSHGPSKSLPPRIRPITPLTGANDGPPPPKRRAFTTRDPQLERHVDELSTPYSRYFVLQCVPEYDGDHRRGQSTARMPIAFCSSLALDLLGIKANESHSIINRDIFAVLAEHGNSPSINKGLRSMILDKMVEGEATSVDLTISAEAGSGTGAGIGVASGRHGLQRHQNHHRRNGSIVTQSGGSHGRYMGFEPVREVAGSCSSSDSDAPRPRLSDTFDRGAEMLSHVLFGHKMRKLVSHWTPLKDAAGQVRFIVLILTPAAN